MTSDTAIPQDEAEVWRQDLALIAEAAREAGSVALGFFKHDPEVWWKNNGASPVSAADFAANERLFEILSAARPGYAWLSEETDDDPARLSHDTVFVVDPIDGTRGFLGGDERWCVSVAVVHRGRPVAGVLYAPALHECFEAAAGGAALKNGKAISVSRSQAGSTGRFAIAGDVLKHLPGDVAPLIDRARHVPSLAYRIAMVADGRLDGTFVKKDSHDWDLAAADLILERAGGRLVDLDGQPRRYNGRAVAHPPLCAAAQPRLQEFVQVFRSLRSG